MTVKEFEEYLMEGIVKKQTPDFMRAKSLLQELEKSYEILNEFIDKFGVSDRNANYVIKNTYDIIMELIRSRMLHDGFSSVGKGAHESEVAYLRKLGFDEIDVEFADKLRFFRNGITYYGKIYGKDYAEKVVNFLEKIYPRLKK